MSGSDYFYDYQIRRLIMQVCRALGGLQVKTGVDSSGQAQFRQVNCRWGQPSRIAAQLMRQVSENTMLYTPLMAVYITNIATAPNRRQNPTHVDTKLVDEREFDETSGKYTENLGDRFTVKRYMPIPYDFTFQLDIWTSNQDQKMQILEQIMMLFNPSIDLQTSDNPLDWTAITFMQLEDNISWTSRPTPVGTDEQIDIASMQFLVPYWINPPAEVTARKAIETIVSNIRSVDELPIDDTDFSWEQGYALFQSIITPGENVLEVSGNELFLLGPGGNETDANGDFYSWQTLLTKFSDFSEEKDNTLIVKRSFGDPDGVQGTIEWPPAFINKLIWNIDENTLPTDTIDPIDAIIDPLQKYPGNGLPAAATGQRYLIVEDIGSGASVWTNIDAKTNSIIEYDGSNWFVSFDSEGNDALVQQIVTNTFTGKQLRWSPDLNDWQFAVDGLYNPGTWKIIS